MENLYLIVGLGNPGSEYEKTRHNAGFLVTDRLAERWHVAWKAGKKFRARLARKQSEGQDLLLCQPQTFMNFSGESVAAVAGFYRIATPRLIVIVDDADLPMGELRLRPGGGAGGHHGLESVQEHLGTKEYARLRVGIGRQSAARQITGHVLGRFDSTETVLLDTVLTAACKQVETWIAAGIQKAMNQFNGAVIGAESEGNKQ